MCLWGAENRLTADSDDTGDQVTGPKKRGTKMVRLGECGVKGTSTPLGIRILDSERGDVKVIREPFTNGSLN